MDDVIFSRIFLLGNFDNFMNLKELVEEHVKLRKSYGKAG